MNRRSFDIAVDYRAERFHRLRKLDANKHCVRFKKVVSSVHFRRRVSDEEQRAQKYDRIRIGTDTLEYWVRNFFEMYHHFCSIGIPFSFRFVVVRSVPFSFISWAQE